MKKEPEQYSDEEAERRALAAIRNSVTTRHVTQQEMVGKVGRPSGRKKIAKAKPARIATNRD